MPASFAFVSSSVSSTDTDGFRSGGGHNHDEPLAHDQATAQRTQRITERRSIFSEPLRVSLADLTSIFVVRTDPKPEDSCRRSDA
jgi:hypothetical protein